MSYCADLIRGDSVTTETGCRRDVASPSSGRRGQSNNLNAEERQCIGEAGRNTRQRARAKVCQIGARSDRGTDPNALACTGR